MVSPRYVTKRNGMKEEVSYDKITKRLKSVASINPELSNVDVFDIAGKVCTRVYEGVKTSELDDQAALLCSSLIHVHPEYATLASRIAISNNHKNTPETFSKAVDILYNNFDNDQKRHPLVSEEIYDIVQKNKHEIDNVIDNSRDYSFFDFFGFKTLEKAYLIRMEDKIIERPQYLFMRVSLGINKNDIKDAIETYKLLSNKYYTHATPTLFNAGTPMPQCSSCFLLQMKDDSIEGIFDTVKECAHISKLAGGIGLHIHNIRGDKSLIRGTNGRSSGIVPLMKVLNDVARYVNQAGRRPGSFAIYLEPHHKDICEFLDLRKNHGVEERRARDLFYALWISDLFMKRVEKNEMWSLMCPDKCRGLENVYGEEYEKLYTYYEEKKMYDKQIKAQDLWFKILSAQIETGTPYMLYKDHVNHKNNQMNLGTIKSSNLCTEIVEYSDENETAVCNLASICLPSFIENNKYNFEKLHDVVKIIVKNLNKVIDVTLYPVKEAETSNTRHRPIGIGVQGLADTFVILKYAFEAEEAKILNKQIFETIYHAALESSMELAKKHKTTYSSFMGSPTSKGILQFDLWKAHVSNDRYNWDILKEDIKKHGLLNSLLVAPMPTATTSQIMGFNEAFEPFTSNIYKRKTMAGEFILVNKYLVKDLQDLGLWNTNMRNTIIHNEGTIQNIPEIPQNIKDMYKTVWEIKQKSVIDMAADRAIFVDQSQSMNIHMRDPDFKKMSSMHFYAWSKGLKTGMYYLRSNSKAKAQQFTMDQNISKFTNINMKEVKSADSPEMVCQKKEDNENGICMMCSS